MTKYPDEVGRALAEQVAKELEAYLVERRIERAEALLFVNRHLVYDALIAFSQGGAIHAALSPKVQPPEPDAAMGKGETRCPYCDGTGDVHRADGEWLGECDCRGQDEALAREVLAETDRMPPTTSRTVFYPEETVIAAMLAIRKRSPDPRDDGEK